MRQVDENDGAALELGADDTLGREAKAIPVEPQRAVQITHTQSDDGEARFHPRTVAHARRERQFRIVERLLGSGARMPTGTRTVIG